MKAIVEVLFLHGIDDCEREWWIQRAAGMCISGVCERSGGVWMIENKKGAERREIYKEERGEAKVWKDKKI